MEKINVAQILKDCPPGTELDCTIFDNVTFDRVDDGGIWIEYIDSKSSKHSLCVYNDGSFPIHNLGSLRTKCVIFPKGKTTWVGFVPSWKFEEGDILHVDCTDEGDDKQDEYIFILNRICHGQVHSYCHYYNDEDFSPLMAYLTEDSYPIRFATEEETQKLLQTIKEHGYKWNEETKALEKLIKHNFKVGDRIKSKHSIEERTINICQEDGYWTTENFWIRISDQDKWELVPNKVDIPTLKPFESKVLVRTTDNDIWRPAIYGFTDSDKYYVVGGFYWEQCIPYEVNKELLGTTNNPKEYVSE